MMLFDAPTRETCAVVRNATNTPLQALVVMNEPQFVEAGVALGNRMIQEGGSSPNSRITYGFRLTTGRKPEPQELAVLEKSLARHLERYKQDEGNAKSLAGTPEQAAYAVLGSTLINLDEFINRP
jgi:alkanesulfonate monooxygenase SsuD/methylene tetrahydromethanopterin reductase-like flavin-dependent oxidoreductase (luciferase family)